MRDPRARAMRTRRTILAIRGALGLVATVGLVAPAGAGTHGYFACPVLVFFAPCPVIEAPLAAAPTGRDTPGIETPRPGPISGEPPAIDAAPRTALTDSAASAVRDTEGARGEPPPIESLWAEPSAGVGAGGSVYVPPRPVREFLEAPTPERARAYLEWNQARLRAIVRAAEVLGQVTGAPPLTGRQAGAGSHAATSACAVPAGAADNPASPEGREAPRSGPVTAAPDVGLAAPGISVLYAFASWCPYSARQTPIVAAWARSRPDVAVTGVLFDAPPGAAVELDGLPFPVHAASQALRDQLGVRSYPTILVFKDGVPVERLVGLTPAARLEAVIRDVGP